MKYCKELARKWFSRFHQDLHQSRTDCDQTAGGSSHKTVNHEHLKSLCTNLWWAPKKWILLPSFYSINFEHHQLDPDEPGGPGGHSGHVPGCHQHLLQHHDHFLHQRQGRNAGQYFQHGPAEPMLLQPYMCSHHQVYLHRAQWVRGGCQRCSLRNRLLPHLLLQLPPYMGSPSLDYCPSQLAVISTQV